MGGTVPFVRLWDGVRAGLVEDIVFVLRVRVELVSVGVLLLGSGAGATTGGSESGQIPLNVLIGRAMKQDIPRFDIYAIHFSVYSSQRRRTASGGAVSCRRDYLPV